MSEFDATDLAICDDAFDSLRAKVAGAEFRAALFGSRALHADALQAAGFIAHLFADAVRRWAADTGRCPVELFDTTWSKPTGGLPPAPAEFEAIADILLATLVRAGGTANTDVLLGAVARTCDRPVADIIPVLARLEEENLIDPSSAGTVRLATGGR